MLSLGGLWLLNTIPNYETYWTACTAGKKSQNCLSLLRPRNRYIVIKMDTCLYLIDISVRCLTKL